MTGKSIPEALVTSSLVPGLNAEGMVTPNWDINILVGAGGILSSVLDLSSFATAQFDRSNEVLALTRKTTYSGYHLNGAIVGI